MCKDVCKWNFLILQKSVLSKKVLKVDFYVAMSCGVDITRCWAAGSSSVTSKFWNQGLRGARARPTKTFERQRTSISSAFAWLVPHNYQKHVQKNSRGIWKVREKFTQSYSQLFASFQGQFLRLVSLGIDWSQASLFIAHAIKAPYMFHKKRT
jgi:hypothetical protein